MTIFWNLIFWFFPKFLFSLLLHCLFFPLIFCTCLNSSYSCVKSELLSHVRHFATPWTIARQAPLSMGFSIQEFWSGLPVPSPSYVKVFNIIQYNITCIPSSIYCILESDFHMQFSILPCLDFRYMVYMSIYEPPSYLYCLLL